MTQNEATIIRMIGERLREAQRLSDLLHEGTLENLTHRLQEEDNVYLNFYDLFVVGNALKKLANEFGQPSELEERIVAICMEER